MFVFYKTFNLTTEVLVLRCKLSSKHKNFARIQFKNWPNLDLNQELSDQNKQDNKSNQTFNAIFWYLTAFDQMLGAIKSVEIRCQILCSNIMQLYII